MIPPMASPDARFSRCPAFLKGEPKALGTVQIMIGCMTFLFGIVLIATELSPAVISGIALWGSLIYISSGALSVAAANQLKPCLVKASLGMNVFSSLVAGLSILLFTVDMVIGSGPFLWCHDNRRDDEYGYGYGYERCDFRGEIMWKGIYGVLLVFALIELIISICTSVFACKATCCSQPTEATTFVMYSTPVGSQPMYNPAFYNPQVQTEVMYQSAPVTYNNF